MEKLAFKLIKQYVTGWKQNDIEKICASLAENCVVIESHGPIYSGIEEIRKWFACWLAAPSKVIKWDIKSFYYCAK